MYKMAQRNLGLQSVCMCYVGDNDSMAGLMKINYF
jgi:hypothetical protein